MSAVEIIDVTPRDGLQNEATTVSTDSKIELIARLVDAGARRIEATSFVHPRLVPQMADADEVMAALPRIDGVSYIGLALNERGVDRALAAQVDEINYVVPVSEAFASANQNTTVERAVAGALYAGRQARAANVPLSVTFAVAFGCPYEGEVSFDQVLRALSPILEAGDVAELALADTIGCANPSQVAGLFDRLRQRTAVDLRAHFHETRHTALANTVAALSVGVRRFDSSVGGLGGCPFAPGAAGNISTEDLAWLLEREGHVHAVDAERATEVGRWICALVGVAPRSGLASAGTFPANLQRRN